VLFGHYCYTSKRILHGVIFGRKAPLLAFVVLLISCDSQRDRTPALAQAFAGPTTLTLRQDLSTKSPVTATVHHGEPLDILEYRRRFLKVRTAGGIAGWTDVKQLLSPEQMADLLRLSDLALSSPSQGVASAFEVLNVHTEASRTSPSFVQIAEGGKVDVVGHKVTPRTQAPTAMPPPPPPKPRTSRRRAKERAAAKIQPPPMPPAPKPPPNWLEMSKPGNAVEAPKKDPNAIPPAPVHLDDWTLIRTKDGKAGWVLSRMLTMSIPDDVAQYAEGHRITSYFPMGKVQDEDQVKYNYLWTTVRSGTENYEFDSWRFFIWSKRHHRYETAYIQRDVVGHYPVVVDTSKEDPTFTLILEGDDGSLHKKTFIFNGYRVSLVESVPYVAPALVTDKQPSLAAAHTPVEAKSGGSWYTSLKDRLTKLLHR
jgi:hypothetical protein